MRNGKRPTRAQKIRLESLGLNPKNWLVIKNHQDGLEVVHRVSGKMRKIPAILGKGSK